MWRIPILWKNIFGPILALFLLVFIGGAGERIEEVSWPDTGNQYFYADSDGDAADSTLLLNTYSVVNTSWTEHFDKRNCFTVSVSENEVCYTCSHDIQVQISLTLSIQRTVGSGAHHVTFAFGKDTAGNIGDGDETGFEQYERDYAANNEHSMGGLSSTSLMTTNQCISLMAKTSDVTGGSDYNFLAATILITEP